MKLSEILKAVSPVCECSMLFGRVTNISGITGITCTCDLHKNVVKDEIIIFSEAKAIQHIEALKDCGYDVVRILENVTI